MSWKSLMSFSGASKERQSSARPDDSSQQSSYQSSVSSPSSRPATRSSSNVSGSKVESDYPHSSVNGKHSSADVLSCLNDKSTDELLKLVSDKDAYNRFFNSLEQVKIQNKVHDELRNETLQLARENLEKGPRLLELRNQSTVIRTSELAHAQEKLNELERQKEQILRTSPSVSLLQNLQDAINRLDEESEVLHRKFLDREIDLANFLPNYKKLRIAHHKKSLLYLAAQTSG